MIDPGSGFGVGSQNKLNAVLRISAGLDSQTWSQQPQDNQVKSPPITVRGNMDVKEVVFAVE